MFSRRLEEHAARMRLRSADQRLRNLSSLPQATAEEKRARIEAFREFWKQVGRDSDICQAATLRERTRRARRRRLDVSARTLKGGSMQHPRCPFYGQHAVRAMRKFFSQGGNQCGLIVESYTPCRMEVQGLEVDFESCEFHGSGRALEFQSFTHVEFVQRPTEGHHHP